MRLSVELLTAAFLQTNAVHEIYQPFRGFEISGVRLLPEDISACGDGFLYVTDEAGIRMHQKDGQGENLFSGRHIVCFLRGKGWLPIRGMMQSASAMGLAEALNALQSIFSCFSDWKQQLEVAMLKSAEPQQLLNLTDPVLRCPVLVYDPALKVLAWSRTKPEGFDDPIFSSAVQEGYLGRDSFRFLEGNQYISKVKKNQLLDLEADEYQQHAICANTVSLGDEIAAFCVMLYDPGVSRAYAKGVFTIFCTFFKELLKLQSVSFQQTRSSFDFLLMDLLENPGLPPEQIQDRLMLTGFSFEGSYVVLTLHSEVAEQSLEAYFINFLRFRSLPPNAGIPGAALQDRPGVRPSLERRNISRKPMITLHQAQLLVLFSLQDMRFRFGRFPLLSFDLAPHRAGDCCDIHVLFSCFLCAKIRKTVMRINYCCLSDN